MAQATPTGETALMEAKKHFYTILRQLPWLQKTIIFAHMPKAAGISLNTVLKKQYGPARVLELDPKNPSRAYREAIQMPFRRAVHLRALSAHIIWGIHAWLPRPFIYITLLRHPVERVLSMYSYILHSTTHRLHADVLKSNMSLEQFLEWDRSAEEVNNLQCRLLSGLYFEPENDLPTLFSRAKENLERYSLVGLTERFSESLHQFAALFGWKNVQIEYDNITPNRIQREDISVQTIHAIEQLNQYDLELYNFAQKLFAEQQQDIHAVFAEKTKK